MDEDKVLGEEEEVADPKEVEEIEEIDTTMDSDEEGEEIEEVADPQESDDSDSTEEQKKQSKEDNSKYAAARREAEKVASDAARQAKELVERQNKFAKSYGYSSFDEMEIAQESQKYVEQGYDEEVAKKIVAVDKLQADLANKVNQARINEEKAKLKDVPFFKDFETEVDSILGASPNLSVSMVFDLVKGQNIDKILQNNGKAAAQKALNSINGKSHIKADGKGVDIDTTSIDEDEFRFYKGLNPKATRNEYAKFMKTQKRR